MGEHKEQHSHSDIEGPFTEQEKQCIRLAAEQDELNGHHHHHHAHKHVEYKRPKELTTAIGLYALKKLDAIEPGYLSVHEKRLLEPVAPGLLSYLTYAGFLGSMGLYANYIYQGLGWRGFAGKAVIPLVGLGVGFKVAQSAMNVAREWQFSPQRAALVDSYSNKLGKQYLLDILDPKFRLD